jgi:hypothetical protein
MILYNIPGGFCIAKTYRAQKKREILPRVVVVNVSEYRVE